MLRFAEICLYPTWKLHYSIEDEIESPLWYIHVVGGIEKHDLSCISVEGLNGHFSFFLNYCHFS